MGFVSQSECAKGTALIPAGREFTIVDEFLRKWTCLCQLFIELIVL